MSGPKVVSVETRLERIAVVRRELRRLAEMLKQWQREQERLDTSEQQKIAASFKRHAELVEELEKSGEILLKSVRGTNDLSALSQEILTESNYIKGALAATRELATKRQAQYLKQQQGVRQTAARLLQEMEARQLQVEPDLQEALQALSQGQSMEKGEQLLQQGFQLVASISPRLASAPLSLAQHELVRRLEADTPRISLAEWKAIQAQNPRLEAAWKAAWKYMAEWEVSGASAQNSIPARGRLGEAQQWATYRSRLEALELMKPGEKQNLYLDSLLLDMGAAAQRVREQRRVLDAALLLLEELKTLSGDVPLRLRQSLEQGLQEKTTEELALLLESVRIAVDNVHRSHQAEARRKAVLDGLAALGYGVTEGMGLVWAEAGRLVLNNPRLPGYGVEVGGSGETGSLQVRSVALSSERDREQHRERDLDVEVLWCQDFERLQKYMEQAGHSFAVERAMPAGATPLKQIDLEVIQNKVVRQNTHQSKV